MQIKYIKNQIIQVHGWKNHQKWRRQWGAEGSGNSHFSDLEAFQLPFWSQAAFGRPIKWKWSKNDPQSDQKLSLNCINLTYKFRYGNKLKLTSTSITKRSHTSWKPSDKCCWRHGGGVCAQRYLDICIYIYIIYIYIYILYIYIHICGLPGHRYRANCSRLV